MKMWLPFHIFVFILDLSYYDFPFFSDHVPAILSSLLAQTCTNQTCAPDSIPTFAFLCPIQFFCCGVPVGLQLSSPVHPLSGYVCCTPPDVYKAQKPEGQHQEETHCSEWTHLFFILYTVCEDKHAQHTPCTFLPLLLFFCRLTQGLF